MGLKISTSKLCSALTMISTLGMLSACAHNPSFNPSQESSDAGAPPVESKPLIDPTQEKLTKLQERVQDLETRLSALNDKINLENGSQGTPGGTVEKKLPTETVVVPPTHAKIIPVKTGAKKSKKEMNEGFASNESVDRFREAKILYDSKKYPDAVLEFSAFVKNEPDHALAPAAQYFLGMSYLNQNEYKLAEEEFSRGLLSYSHSSYTPDTLLALAQVSEKLNKQNKVSYYKEKILSNFPNSPQAKSLSLNSPKLAPETNTTDDKASEMPSGEASVVEKPLAPMVPAVKPEISGESE